MLRRRLTALAAVALLLAAAACGDDSDDEATGSGEDPTGVAPSDTDGAGDGDDAAEADQGGGATAAAGSTGRLEIDGEDYNLRLGDSATAQCSVSESSVVIQDLRASDGSWVGVALNDPGSVIWEATLRGPDGNREWFTGNTGDAEGLDATYSTADNVFMVSGEWARADDPSETADGTLVVTC